MQLKWEESHKIREAITHKFTEYLHDEVCAVLDESEAKLIFLGSHIVAS